MPAFEQAEFESTQKLSAAIRARPAMYFGVRGVDATPQMIHWGINDLLGLSPAYRERIEVRVSAKNAIAIRFDRLKSKEFSPNNTEAWFKNMFQGFRQAGHTIGLVALASEEFCLTSSDGTRKATLNLANGKRPVIRSRATHGEPFVQLSFVSALQPAANLTHDHLYSVASRLKDSSLLRPGLQTCLSAAQLGGEMHYFYERGLRSLIIEDDHARWPLHADCIKFKGKRREMRIEGYLRFLHAGLPVVRSYVNFWPSQGGAHHEGLGRALTEVFPDSTHGCRKVLFITNSNSGAAVELPHSFIGAVHLQLEDPRFEGPTKDILIGDDVRDFVRHIATKQVKEQWAELRSKR